MGSGFPLAGVIASKKVIDNKIVSGLSSTHSSNSLVCAAGIVTLDELNRKRYYKKTQLLGKYFHKELKNLKTK